jgi:DNA-binding NtrC family response regulator
LLAESAGLLRGKTLNKEAVSVLVNYLWPGNIRELRSVLTRAGIDYEGHEIGSVIAEFFEKDFPSHTTAAGNGKLDKIWDELKEGKTFWEAVWNPFIERELDRETVKAVLSKVYSENGHNFKNMLQTLNIEDKKYHNFMGSL